MLDYNCLAVLLYVVLLPRSEKIKDGINFFLHDSCNRCSSKLTNYSVLKKILALQFMNATMQNCYKAHGNHYPVTKTKLTSCEAF